MRTESSDLWSVLIVSMSLSWESRGWLFDKSHLARANGRHANVTTALLAGPIGGSHRREELSKGWPSCQVSDRGARQMMASCRETLSNGRRCWPPGHAYHLCCTENKRRRRTQRCRTPSRVGSGAHCIRRLQPEEKQMSRKVSVQRGRRSAEQ